MAAGKPFLAHWRDALRDSALGEKAKLAGFVISTYADSHGRCFPSKRSIANGMSVKSTRTADTAVAELEAARFTTVSHSKGRSSNHYALTIPTPQGVAGFEQFNHAAGNPQPRKNGRSTTQQAAHESGSTKAKSESVELEGMEVDELLSLLNHRSTHDAALNEIHRRGFTVAACDDDPVPF